MLKRKNTTIPWYMDPWVWVKMMVFVIFILFLIWPFSSIITNAFKSTKAEGFTLLNFNKFFTKKYYYGALWNSVGVSLVPSLFAILLGVPMAYLMTRYNVWGKKIWHVLAILSLMSPPFLGAYAWIMMFGRAGSVTTFLAKYGITIPTIYGFGGIAAVLTLKLYPYIYMYTSGAMESIDSSLEECAENLGSGKLRRFFTVTMTVVTPSITARALVVFMSALADFGTPMLLGGQDFRTLPVLIYNEYLSETGGNGNLASAISIIIVIITLLMLMVQKIYVGRRNYVMSALRPPKVTEVHGFRRFLVTLPVFLISFISFLPQIVVCSSSFQHTNYLHLFLHRHGVHRPHRHPHVLRHRPQEGQDRRHAGHAADGPLRDPRLGAGPVLHRHLQRKAPDSHRYRRHHHHLLRDPQAALHRPQRQRLPAADGSQRGGGLHQPGRGAHEDLLEGHRPADAPGCVLRRHIVLGHLHQ